MNNFAMWIGYAVMVIAAAVAVAVAGGWAVQQLWRELLREVPNMHYLAAAVAHYKTVKPAPDGLLSEDEQRQQAIERFKGGK